jgi:tRNA(fMet)-specific endonuclease VapC
MFLLDTNHCSRAIEEDERVLRQIIAHETSEVSTCVIVSAELLFMAYRSDRVAWNLERVHTFLSGIAVYQIDDQVADAYGQIKAGVFRRFGPKERAKQRHTTLERLGVTENDLWIAAIAIRHGMTVVSSDKDFARIAEVTDLQHESWLIDRNGTE